MYRLPLPLQQQYRPPSILATNIGASASAATSSAEALAISGPLASSQLFTFDRTLDTICNLSVTKPAAGAPGTAGDNKGAAMNDITAVAWLPTPPPPPAAPAATDAAVAAAAATSKVSPAVAPAATLSGVLSAAAKKNIAIPPTGAAVAVAPTAASEPAAAWLLAIMPNGCIRAVCPTAGGTTSPHTDILSAVPDADVPKIMDVPVFGTTANDIVAFTTPLGSASPPPPPPPTTSHEGGSAPAALSDDSKHQQQHQPATKPRGRGSNFPTSGAPPSPALATTASVGGGGAASATAAASSSASAGAATTTTFSSRACMMSAMFYRAGCLHTALLDCPTESVATTVGGLKLVAEHSLGKETAPPEKLFRTIDVCKLHHIKVPAAASSSFCSSSSCANYYAGRHILLVHLVGNSLVSGANNEKISAHACFEIVRKGAESLTVSRSSLPTSSCSSSSSSSPASPLLCAILLTPWTIFSMSGNVGATVMSAAGQHVQVLKGFAPVVSTAILGHAMSTICANNASGEGSEATATSNNNQQQHHHIHIALGHAGSPAALRTAVISLGPAHGAAAATTVLPRPQPFLFQTTGGSGGSHSSSASSAPLHPNSTASLIVNAKARIAKVTSLLASPGTSLLAVVTTDNVIQIFCVVFRTHVVLMSGAEHNARARRSRVEDDAHSSEKQQQQTTEGAERSSSSLPSSSPPPPPSIWRLFDHRKGGSDDSALGCAWPALAAPRPASSSSTTQQQQLQRLQQPQLTLINSISLPAASLHNPVDDISIIMCSVPIPLAAAAPGSSVVSSSSSSGSSSQTVSKNIPLLIVTLGLGAVHSFPLLGASEPRLLRAEARSLLSTGSGYLMLTTTLPVAASNFEAGWSGPSARYCMATLYGSQLLVMRPKKLGK